MMKIKLEDALDDYLKKLNGSGGQIIKEELGEEFFNRAVIHLEARGQHFMDDEGRFLIWRKWKRLWKDLHI
jgi:hypothetical protein